MKINCNILLIVFNILTIFYNARSVEGIIGGTDALAKEFKHQVSVQANDEHICGGAIIDEQHVITAASCFIDNAEHFINKNYTIVAGTANLKDTNRIVVLVEQIFIPREYYRTSRDSSIQNYLSIGDVAIVKLEKTLNLNENSPVAKIDLPTTPQSRKVKYVFKQCNFTGFGIENLNARSSNKGRGVPDICIDNCFKLKYAKPIIIHKNSCSSWYRTSLDGKHICAQVKRVGDFSQLGGPCDGDIGGPLVEEKEKILVGILSRHSDNCNDHYQPGIYTRITEMMPFIEKVLVNKNLLEVRYAGYVYQRETVRNTVELRRVLVEISR